MNIVFEPTILIDVELLFIREIDWGLMVNRELLPTMFIACALLAIREI